MKKSILFIIIYSSIFVSCDSEMSISETNLMRSKWNSLQTKFLSFERDVNDTKEHIPEPDWVVIIDEMSKSKEWEVLVNILRKSKESQDAILEIYKDSNTTYSDSDFKLVHAIPCLLYESNGGNLSGLLNHYHGLRFRTLEVSEILLSDKINFSDYTGIFEINYDSIDYGVPLYR